jgi:broad specificity phosphatase PhoE
VPSSEWQLSEQGFLLASHLALLPIFGAVSAVYTSPELKAVATGQPLGTRFAVPLIEHPGLSELKRGQTNIAGREAYERMVRIAFGRPHESVSGWERATDAQQRIIATVEQLAAQHVAPFAVVSHGLVLSLLMAHFNGSVTVDYHAWRAIPLPALAAIDTATWQVLTPFMDVAAWQERAG